MKVYKNWSSRSIMRQSSQHPPTLLRSKKGEINNLKCSIFCHIFVHLAFILRDLYICRSFTTNSEIMRQTDTKKKKFYPPEEVVPPPLLFSSTESVSIGTNFFFFCNFSNKTNHCKRQPLKFSLWCTYILQSAVFSPVLCFLNLKISTKSGALEKNIRELWIKFGEKLRRNFWKI